MNASSQSRRISHFMVSTCCLLLLFLTSEVAAAPCPLCPGGASYTLPDKAVVIPGQPGALPCSQLESVFLFILPDEDSEECKLGQRFTTICGCPRPDDSCDLCPDGFGVQNLDEPVPEFYDILNAVPSCETTEAYMHSYSKDDPVCNYAQRHVAEKCGCNTSLLGDEDPSSDVSPNLNLNPTGLNLFISVWGADSAQQVKRLKHLTRGSGILSLIGALAIILDNLCNRKGRKQFYNRIVTLMAIFDVISSCMWILGDIATPEKDEFYSRTDRGTDGTCILQGALLNWGTMTSLFLNASLATFYVLVLTIGWTRQMVEKWRMSFLVIPFVAGAVFGFATIPFIAPGIVVCCMPPPIAILQLSLLGYPITWAPFLCLFLIPAYLVIIYATGTMVYGFRHVRKIEHNAPKEKSRAAQSSTAKPSNSLVAPNDGLGSSTTLGSDSRKSQISKLRKEVVRQSILYLISLHLCWLTCLFSSSLSVLLIAGYYELWVTMYFLLPLQGFLNAVVYFRPRLVTLATVITKKTRWILSRNAEIGHSSEPPLQLYAEPSFILMDLNAAELLV